MKVKSMISSNGNPVANQFIITTDEKFVNDEGQTKTATVEYFQSYQSIIAKKEYRGWDVVITLDGYYWNYSRTTSKYRSMFLNESTKETQRKIDDGEYVLADLNEVI